MESKGRRTGRRATGRTTSSADPNSPVKMWEEEKQKLLKKYESQKKALEKERKKLETERKATEKKRLRYLKEKGENDKLKVHLNAEKEIWLNRHKRSKNYNGPALLAIVIDNIKEWEGKQDDAKQEWGNIEKAREELKGRRSALEADQEKLAVARAELDSQFNELDGRSEVLDKFLKKNAEEKARLKVKHDRLKKGEKTLEKRKTEYEALDAEMKERELAVKKKDADVAKERTIVDKIRKNILASLEQSRRDFVKKSDELHAEVSKWKRSFAELVSIEEKSVK